ncbi:hypothetical protein Scep_007610 [Stephania cephalantha]|uniref:Kinesin motor domain-containing protein n=1 Tax=Stephania cephalantha TaxID=152367 RepID=A0AAP0PLA4_9MAGN
MKHNTGRRSEVLWPRIIMRKWLNIRNKESILVDHDEGDTQSDSDDEGGGPSGRWPRNTDGSGLALYASSQIDRFSSWKVSSSISCPQLEQNVKVVPEQQQKGLEQTILHLEGEVIGLRQKKRSLDAKRREALNKILDIKGSIRVFCRPFLITDKRRNQEPICVRSEKLAVSFGGSKKEFGFDKVFPQNASQEDVFMEVEPILRSALDGHNVCIMAYGQTGTGKTFTMVSRDLMVLDTYQCQDLGFGLLAHHRFDLEMLKNPPLPAGYYGTRSCSGGVGAAGEVRAWGGWSTRGEGEERRRGGDGGVREVGKAVYGGPAKEGGGDTGVASFYIPSSVAARAPPPRVAAIRRCASSPFASATVSYL